MITIIADDRETNGANPFFDKFIVANNAKYSKVPIKDGGGSIKLCINRVTTGDYNILLNNPQSTTPIVAMIIERKTWKDLAASFKDGRSQTQHKEMLSVQSRTGCILMYLIEGKICYDKDYKVNRIPFANLDAKRRHLSLRGHSVLQTKDQEHTAEMIVNLARDVWRFYQAKELTFGMLKLVEKSQKQEGLIQQHEKQKQEEQKLTYQTYAAELRDLNNKYSHLGNKRVFLNSLVGSSKTSILPKTSTKNTAKPTNLIPLTGELEIIDDIDEIDAVTKVATDITAELVENSDESDIELAANLALLKVHSDETTIPAILTERKIRPDSDIVERMWIAIPGVSVKSAPVLMEKYRIGDLVTADMQTTKLTKQIAELQYPTGRRFGDELAKKIMKLAYAGKGVTQLDNLKHISMCILAEIPGVTRDSAKAILDTYSLRQICSGEVNEDDLAEIQKNGGRKIGSKTAQKIIELLL